MGKIRDIGFVVLMTLGGIIATDTIVAGFRGVAYNDQREEIARKFDHDSRNIQIKKLDKQFKDSREMAYTTFGVVGGLIGLIASTAVLSSKYSDNSSNDDIYVSERTAGEHYMGIR